jgi:hypothetical protein
VEGIRGVAAVRSGVGQRPDDVEELGDRAGPAVGEDQGGGCGLRRANVEEVDVDAVDGGQELGVLVDARLEAVPVVLLAPVLAEA